MRGRSGSEGWSATGVARRLAAESHAVVDPGATERHAAVTLVVRPRDHDLEVLFVRRAEVPGDPWSGHMALPGGHRDAADADLLETARRELREEVGLDLPRSGYLGRLDDLHPVTRRIPSILISPFVAWHGENIRVSTNAEVQYHIWAPLRALRDPALRSEVRYPDGGREHVWPSILYEGDAIWGLTHRVVMNFLDIITERTSQ
ncbi:NUDIX hydrolase [Candidatus Palauibacter sp.]|uniref:NUDIX hydrolase n=1 Tax=Candidatus Palauibacter sp. TaxID=3101350 RepID=UPI003B011701